MDPCAVGYHMQGTQQTPSQSSGCLWTLQETPMRASLGAMHLPQRENALASPHLILNVGWAGVAPEGWQDQRWPFGSLLESLSCFLRGPTWTRKGRPWHAPPDCVSGELKIQALNESRGHQPAEPTHAGPRTKPEAPRPDSRWHQDQDLVAKELPDLLLSSLLHCEVSGVHGRMRLVPSAQLLLASDSTSLLGGPHTPSSRSGS